MVDEIERAELIGLGQGEIRLPLDEVYVPLRLSRDDLRHHLGEDPGFAVDVGPIAAEAVFRATTRKHAIVLGQPGSGKTTALEKLHRSCITAGPGSLGLGEDALPVFLRLRTFAPRHLEGSLAEYLSDELEAASGGRVPRATTEALIRHRCLLLLFDGLDEIADEAHRAKALRYLVWQVRSWNEARALVSCRNAGWPEAAESPELQESFSRHDVCPFDDGQIAAFIENWYREASKVVPNFTRDEALDAAARLHRTLLHDPELSSQAIKGLVSTPLFLTLLCVVVMKGGEIPRRRVDFYEECVRVMAERWRRELGSRAPVEPEAALEALGALAWALHSRHRKEDLTEIEALKGIRREIDVSRPLARSTFLWSWKEAGLLVRLSERHFGFPHLNLQEHLTARHLARHEDLLEEVSRQYRESWWKEVFLLVCGLPERSGFGALVRGLMRHGALDDGMDLLAACMRETRRLDPDPFREALHEGDAARQGAVLRLLARYAVPAVLELVEEFAHSDGPRSPAVAAQAAALLEAHASGAAAARDGVFLICHAEDREPSKRVRAELEKHGVRVANRTDASAWESCHDDAESATGLLVLLGAGALDGQQVRHW